MAESILPAGAPTFLKYKYVIFKTTFTEDGWEEVSNFSFDTNALPSLQTPNGEGNGTPNLGLLLQFRKPALAALETYLRDLNNDIRATPRGCKWIIKTVDVEEEEGPGLGGSKQFAVALEMAGWDRLFGEECEPDQPLIYEITEEPELEKEEWGSTDGYEADCHNWSSEPEEDPVCALNIPLNDDNQDDSVSDLWEQPEDLPEESPLVWFH
ncbi:hypothetical protein TWF718_002472 [Orbilia javanica]|uniref:Uncharacterized protein n=1 Tax=Orbilia javanica TaxID=47235 RepID=A0AAN8RCE6_9PEZI